MEMTTRPRGNIVPRSEVIVTKEKIRTFKDFPEPKLDKDITLDILKSGKKVSPSSLSKYLKIGYNAAEERLKQLEKKGLCTSERMRIKDQSGRPNVSRIYYIKIK